MGNQEVIQEDIEKEGEEPKKPKSIFSLNDLSINSPRYKLKVDELDKGRDHRENSFNFSLVNEEI